MKNNKTGMLVAVLLMILGSAVLIPAVSASEQNQLSDNARDILQGIQGMESIKVVVNGEKETTTYLWVDAREGASPIRDICTFLEKAIAELEAQGEKVTQVRLIVESETERIEYAADSPSSTFEKVFEGTKSGDTSADSQVEPSPGQDLLLRDYTLTHYMDKSFDDNVVTHWAGSYTTPSTTLPVMSATSRILKWNGIRWNDYSVVSNSQWYVPLIEANGASSLSSGTYKQRGEWSGLYVNGTRYSAQLDGSSFTI